jgi:hypothetical protein
MIKVPSTSLYQVWSVYSLLDLDTDAVQAYPLPPSPNLQTFDRSNRTMVWRHHQRCSIAIREFIYTQWRVL